MTDEAKQSEQSEGIAAKVDVGFVRPAEMPTWPKQLSAGVIEKAGRTMPSGPSSFSTTEILGKIAAQSNEMRLEALKLAYEVAFKVNSFNFPIEFNKKTQEEQQSDYEDVLALADINYQFIVSGKTNID